MADLVESNILGEVVAGRVNGEVASPAAILRVIYENIAHLGSDAGAAQRGVHRCRGLRVVHVQKPLSYSVKQVSSIERGIPHNSGRRIVRAGFIRDYVDSVDVEEVLVAAKWLGQGAIVKDVTQIFEDVGCEGRIDLGRGITVAENDDVDPIV